MERRDAPYPKPDYLGRARAWAFGDRAAIRLGRFAATGVAAAVAQLTLLAVFLHAGAPPTFSNALAIGMAAQLNFGLSRSFTWHDRPRERRLVFDWMRFMATVSASAALNLTVFEATRRVIEPLPAAALGILAGAALNFVVADRLIFTARAAGHLRRGAQEAHP
jgi:putative flippase GtrA